MFVSGAVALARVQCSDRGEIRLDGAASRRRVAPAGGSPAQDPIALDAVSSQLAASHPNPPAAGHILHRVDAGARRVVGAVPMPCRLSGIAVLGALTVAAVAGTTGANPLASPHGAAVELRVVIIVALIAAGLYAQTSR